MAYGNPSSGGDEYFSDGAAPKMEEGEKTPESETAILPKSILAGKEFKPGEEVVLKIVAIHDNDVEVAYASEPKEEGGEEYAGKEPDAAPPGDMMQSMME